MTSEFLQRRERGILINSFHPSTDFGQLSPSQAVLPKLDMCYQKWMHAMHLYVIKTFLVAHLISILYCLQYKL